MLRFWEKVEPVESGCWLWRGAISSAGYGSFRIDGKTRSAHRVSYEMHKGPIPKKRGYHGCVLRHRCDVRACVNPDHLRTGSQKDNIQDAASKGRLGNGSMPGEANPACRWKDAQIAEMHKLRASGHTQQKIADAFGTQQAVVSRILSGKRRARQHVSISA